ncbi:MAG: glucose 1-dehydrogenase [Deltaproteobacteria bacterium]|nr:glucose 1-dehydrogenase [Deltaproteobacteria bacterium]
MHRVEGKVAIVTGGASGIGRGCARRLAAEGAHVVVADRDEVGGQRVVDELGTPHRFLALDVTSEAGWKRVVAETVKQLGRLDILVNAAGIAIFKDIERTTLEDWRLINGVNSDGVFLGCKAVLVPMKAAGGGSIINLSSVAGLIGVADAPAYCASKGAVRLLTKSVALHAARSGYNIRCNSVHPSFIDTPMCDAVINGAPDPAKARKAFERAAPLGRMGQVDDVAHLVVYLASDESRFVTGAEIAVDGGLTAM